jgi:hypothetical protein
MEGPPLWNFEPSKPPQPSYFTDAHGAPALSIAGIFVAGTIRKTKAATSCPAQ